MIQQKYQECLEYIRAYTVMVVIYSYLERANGKVLEFHLNYS